MRIICDCGKEIIHVPVPPPLGANSDLATRAGIRVDIRADQVAVMASQHINHMYPLLISCDDCRRVLILVEDHRRAPIPPLTVTA